ncbi:MAG: methyltransferase domain-containing protein [Spirulina sp.]
MHNSRPASDPPSLTAADWERRYQEGSTRWDLGQAAPGLQALLADDQTPAPGRAMVLGAGRGHDALLLASHGFAVTAVDFAPSAIRAMAEQAAAVNLSITLLEQNIFDLVPEWAGQFDYVVEHTCFCAIAPNLRPAYSKLAADLLVPGGELLAVFFTHSRGGGPPFGISLQELQEIFSPYFAVDSLHPVANSIPTRQGEEHLGRFRRLGEI